MVGLILCAGLGTRLKEETKDKPKCMVEVGGKPVLERIADHMNKHGIWRIVVNLHAFPEVVMKAFGQRFIYIYEPIPVGEYNTIQMVKGLFPNEDIVVMNGDTITDIDLDTVPVGSRCYSKKTGRHMGTSVFSGTNHYYQRLDVDCEYFDIGTPEKLEIARKRYA